MKKVFIEKACTLVTDGTHYTPPDVGEGYPFLTVKNMNRNGLDFKYCSFITKEQYQKALNGNSCPQ